MFSLFTGAAFSLLSGGDGAGVSLVISVAVGASVLDAGAVLVLLMSAVAPSSISFTVSASVLSVVLAVLLLSALSVLSEGAVDNDEEATDHVEHGTLNVEDPLIRSINALAAGLRNTG